MVSQFMMELQGLKTVDGEDPPRILHFNPRLRGDWSGKPVIEQNTCYGKPMRGLDEKNRRRRPHTRSIVLSIPVVHLWAHATALTVACHR